MAAIYTATTPMHSIVFHWKSLLSDLQERTVYIVIWFSMQILELGLIRNVETKSKIQTSSVIKEEMTILINPCPKLKLHTKQDQNSSITEKLLS